jgi:non-heme chloroperoxidase
LLEDVEQVADHLPAIEKELSMKNDNGVLTNVGEDSAVDQPTPSVSRRSMILSGAAIAVSVVAQPAFASEMQSSKPMKVTTRPSTVDTITVKDGTRIYFKDWGNGQPIVFSHGWPLSADAWDAQMLYFGQKGYRVIAHDRRGHGRSSQSWNGNDMDTYADDLSELIEKLDLKDVILVGHSAGGGEVARYLGRHGSKRVAKVVLIAAVTPFLLGTADHPGAPMSVFDGLRQGVVGNRAQFFRDLSIPFYGYNRADAKQSDGIRDSFWSQGMAGSVKSDLDCIKAFGETDFREDLKEISVPTLILQGDDDQIVPLKLSSPLAAKLVKNSTLKIYPGQPHGLCTTFAEQVNADLLAFFKA